MAKRPGPKPFVLTSEQKKLLAGMSGILCTYEEMASIIGIHRETLRDKMQEDPGLTAAIKQARDGGRMSIRRAQFKSALKGNPTMLIWLGKQLLGQRDHRDLTINPSEHAKEFIRRITEKDPALGERLCEVLEEMDEATE